MAGRATSCKVGTGANPADGAVGLGTADLVGPDAEGGGHHRNVHRGRDAAAGLVKASRMVHRTFLEQRLADADVLAQVSQGRAEVGPDGLLHARLPAGAQPQAEPSGGELGQGQRLLRHGDGMPGEGLGDGRSHHDVAGAGSGGGEDAEGLAASGAAAGHPGGGDAPSLHVLHGGQGGVAVGRRHYCANPLLGHIVPPRLAACSRISPHGLRRYRPSEVYEGVMASSTTPGAAIASVPGGLAWMHRMDRILGCGGFLDSSFRIADGLARPGTMMKMDDADWEIPLTQPSPTRGEGYFHRHDGII